MASNLLGALGLVWVFFQGFQGQRNLYGFRVEQLFVGVQAARFGARGAGRAGESKPKAVQPSPHPPPEAVKSSPRPTSGRLSC